MSLWPSKNPQMVLKYICKEKKKRKNSEVQKTLPLAVLQALHHGWSPRVYPAPLARNFREIWKRTGTYMPLLRSFQAFRSFRSNMATSGKQVHCGSMSDARFRVSFLGHFSRNAWLWSLEVILVSHDVSSLFNNVPLEETIQILADKAFTNNW